MKKVKVCSEECIGCGACIAVDSEHFDFDNENGCSKVISENNIEENATLMEAIDSCPVGAIKLFDGCENENCTCDPCNCGEDCKCNDINKEA